MRLDRFGINEKISKAPQVESAAAKAMRRRFEEAHERLLRDFDEHPVTLELRGGPTAQNLSGTLGGRGNLFSFIGFPEGSNPTQEVRSILDTQFRLIPRDRKLVGNNILFNYRVLIPEDALRARTPLPFETGNSWLYGIEEGISGFSQYVYTKVFNKNSRSGTGLQVEGVNMGGQFSPTPYITEIINNFRLRMRAL